jgi:hypothetical protein
MADRGQLPPHVIVFGPEANCTLEICPIEWSVYKYKPDLPTNIIFLVLFAIAMLIHIYLGIRWRSWFFMSFMIVGCLMEIIGYVGRLIMHDNPFSFPGFMIQIVFITTGPVWYTAAIYVTLSKTINALAPEISRVNPKLFYWIFIPADVVCLILQAAGGALSTVSQGGSQTGIDIAMAGLILQVIILALFIVALSDYMIRYFRSGATGALNNRTRIYFAGLTTAIILILGRCFYRCYELSEGYQDSNLITDEALFIGLEGVLVLLAVYCLCIGHPGLVQGSKAKSVSRGASDEETISERKPNTVMA